MIIVGVSDLKVYKLYPVDIVFRSTEKIFGWRLQIFYLLQRQRVTHIIQSNLYQLQAIYTPPLKTDHTEVNITFLTDWKTLIPMELIDYSNEHLEHWNISIFI